MDDARFMVQLGDLQLGEPVELLDQVLELFIADDLLFFGFVLGQVHGAIFVIIVVDWRLRVAQIACFGHFKVMHSPDFPERIL